MGTTESGLERRRPSPAVASASRLNWRRALSPRELTVALLVGEGARNSAIARDLGISPRTVEKHISAIFTKLGFRSRAELAIFIARHVPG